MCLLNWVLLTLVIMSYRVIWPSQYFVDKTWTSMQKNIVFALHCSVWLIIFEIFWICCVEMTNDKYAFITSQHIQNELMLRTFAKKNKTMYSKWCPVTLSISSTCFTKSSIKDKKVKLCNRVHLHIVFVLLYVLCVCRSVGVHSCVYVSRSFTYVLRVVIYTSLWDMTISESERRWMGRTTTSHMYHPKEKKK